MQISVETQSFGVISVSLLDEARVLANFLSILRDEQVEGLCITDYPGERYPKVLSRFSGLKSLSLVRCHGLSVLPKEILKCAGLEKLSIVSCADFYDLTGISSCCGLKFLQVRDCEQMTSAVRELAAMKTLAAIDFSYCEHLVEVDWDALPESLRILDIHKCARLMMDEERVNRLSLVSTRIQDYPEKAESGEVLPDIYKSLLAAQRIDCSRDL